MSNDHLGVSNFTQPFILICNTGLEKTYTKLQRHKYRPDSARRIMTS